MLFFSVQNVEFITQDILNLLFNADSRICFDL